MKWGTAPDGLVELSTVLAVGVVEYVEGVGKSVVAIVMVSNMLTTEEEMFVNGVMRLSIRQPIGEMVYGGVVELLRIVLETGMGIGVEIWTSVPPDPHIENFEHFLFIIDGVSRVQKRLLSASQ